MSIMPTTAQSVLHVSDLKAAIAYYTTVLGCQEDFIYEGRYAGLRFGQVHIHLAQGSGPFNRPVGGANVYFTVESPADVDACYAEITAKGGRTDKPPENYPYGMRDFVAFDPDGNMLSFGADTEG